MTEEFAGRRPPSRPRVRRRPVWRWVILGLALLLLALAAWIVTRGLIARDQLTSAIPVVEELKSKILSGDTDGLEPLAKDLAARASTAASLTSDPIWRAAEVVPLLGPNLRAFREAAGAIETVADGALPPLVSLAGQLDFGRFVPRDGVIDTAPIEALQPALAEAGAAVAAAAAEAGAIDTSGTIPQIGEAVEQLVDVVSEASGLIGGANGLVQVLPAMLGADGPRTTLLLVQNNAELRATGGIPGAIIELRTDQGRIEFGTQASAATIGQFDEPVLVTTKAEQELYGDRFARFVQNVTTTPDFARTGELTAAMWQQRYGESIDAVVSVDPVVLSYVLRATGPLTLADGTLLSADNAVKLLLNEVYLRFDDPLEQDAFFGLAARTVFDAVTRFTGDPATFVEAIGAGVADRRVYIWSADPSEQEVIEGSSLADLYPRSDAMASGFGLYLADLTMSKIDWYLEPSVEVGGVHCPEWGSHSYYVVRLTLTSTVPPLGEGLPNYIVGAPVGDSRGTALTQAYLTMPAGFRVFQTFVDGQDAAVQVVDAGDEFSRYAITTVVPPGETRQVDLRIWGNVDSPAKVRLVHTPTAGVFETASVEGLRCPTPDEIPTDEPGIVAFGPSGLLGVPRFGA